VSKQQDQGDKILGQPLPGTGGDLEPAADQDVEGHRAKSDGPTSFNPDAPRPGEGLRQVDGTDDQDVEGHLYRTGPTTDGE